MRDPSTRIPDTPGNAASPAVSATVADTTRPAALARTCATLPSATTRPWRTSTIRSAYASASSR